MADRMQSCFFFLLLAVLYLFNVAFCGDPLTLIRGVSLKNQAFYNPLKEFTCLDGSRTIPFSSVNDDYCDCPDSSDEPGTAACPEGKFYCSNVGFRGKFIQSSRVNDGICDCCDGSDEYDSNVACFNECEKLSMIEREKRQKELEEANHGYNQKLQFIEEGKSTKAEKQKRFEHIKTLLEERRVILEELKSHKDAAESPEKEAKDKHKSEWEDMKAKLKEEKEIIERGEAFQLLDTDKNGWITIAEMMSNNFLDGDLSENDAKEFLGGEAMVDMEKFVDTWPLMKAKFFKDGRPKPAEPDSSQSSETQGESESESGDGAGEGEAPQPEDIPPPSDEPPQPPPSEEGFDSHDIDATDDDEDDNDVDYDEEDEDDREDDEESQSEKRESINTDDHEQMPEYDEETKKLIEVAEEARKKFNEEDQKVRELDREHQELETYLGVDFGPEEEFAPLKGHCFEYTDREYTYKLCPFDKVTQRPKDGGSETDLGKWGHWQEVGGHKYGRMKYENGQGCWNGPSRSALIRLSCGKENQLASATEPSRCEYEMEFKTPSLCIKHDEL